MDQTPTTPAAGSREAIVATLASRHPGTVAVAQFFAWAHLPEHLQVVSAPCCALALTMVDRLPDGPELTVGLRKLLEAKDAFVRQAI